MHPMSTCRYETPDVDMSGSPCQDWTRRSHNPLGRKGKRASLLITWCRIMVESQPPIIFHENVRGFDGTILEQLMGHLYTIVHLKVFNYIYTYMYIYVYRSHMCTYTCLRDTVERYIFARIRQSIMAIKHSHIYIYIHITVGRPILAKGPAVAFANLTTVMGWPLLACW